MIRGGRRRSIERIYHALNVDIRDITQTIAHTRDVHPEDMDIRDIPAIPPPHTDKDTTTTDTKRTLTLVTIAIGGILVAVEMIMSDLAPEVTSTDLALDPIQMKQDTGTLRRDQRHVSILVAGIKRVASSIALLPDTTDREAIRGNLGMIDITRSITIVTTPPDTKNLRPLQHSRRSACFTRLHHHPVLSLNRSTLHEVGPFQESIADPLRRGLIKCA